MTNIHNMVGRHNMAVMFVRLAFGEPIRIRNASDYAEGYYLVRSVDTVPAIVRGSDLLKGLRGALA